MDKDLQGKLVEILTSIQTAVGKATDFTLEQLPDVVVTYIQYGIVWGAIRSLVLVVLVFGLCWAIYKIFVKYKSEPESALLLFPAAAIVGCAIAAMHSVKDLLLVAIAPKVWLLMEIGAMLK